METMVLTQWRWMIYSGKSGEDRCVVVHVFCYYAHMVYMNQSNMLVHEKEKENAEDYTQPYYMV